jgi:hypothetical protein
MTLPDEDLIINDMKNIMIKREKSIKLARRKLSYCNNSYN